HSATVCFQDATSGETQRVSVFCCGCILSPVCAWPVVAEVPGMAFEVLRHVAARTVFLVSQFPGDRGTAGLCVGKMGVRIVDMDAHRMASRRKPLRADATLLGAGGANHDHSGSHTQLGMNDGTIVPWHHHTLREAERRAKPFDGDDGIVVVK